MAPEIKKWFAAKNNILCKKAGPSHKGSMGAIPESATLLDSRVFTFRMAPVVLKEVSMSIKNKGIIIAGILSLIFGMRRALFFILEFVYKFQEWHIIKPVGKEELFFELVFGAIFGISVAISAVFIFKLNNWARKLLVFLLTLYLIMGLSCSIICLTIVKSYGNFIPEILKIIAIKYNFELIGDIYGLTDLSDASSFISAILSLVLPILLIYFFTRPEVKKQFKPEIGTCLKR